MTVLASLAGIVLVIALIVQIIYLFKKADSDPLSHFLLLLAALLLAAVTVQRSIAISFIALTGTFESLIFYSALVCLITGIYRIQKKIPYHKIIAFIAAVFALVILAVASSPLTQKEALAPIPALRSHWLILHVSFAFIGEAFFAVSFAAAVLSLAAKSSARRDECDRVMYTSIAIGYPLFTAGALIFGAIWAQEAWGTWWGWDPKETWGLITWLVYTAYLHFRLIAKKRGKLCAIVAVIGFLCTLFTFFGVNYLLPGLHSYR
jgi:ABC-type transport system involved in cytochrome c biogenesis permease subunit